MGGEKQEQKGREFAAVVTKAFSNAAREAHFEPTVLGADRHGSLVWEAVLKDNLNRYILLGATPQVAPTDDEFTMPYVDAYVGADDGHRFHREYVSMADLGNIEAGQLKTALLRLTKRAMAFTDRDLDETYIVPRDAEPRPLHTKS